MPSHVVSGADGEQDLVHRFTSSLEGGYASTDGEPFYARTELRGPAIKDGEHCRIVAYHALYAADHDPKPQAYVVIEPATHQAFSQQQLMGVLLAHGAPDVYEPDTAQSRAAANLQLLALEHLAEVACLLAAPWHLPLFAALHVVTQAGEDRVEFAAPRQVDGEKLIRYVQLGHVVGQP